MEITLLTHQLRQFNREYTAKIGLLEKYVLDTPYTFAQSRVLLEIGGSQGCTATQLATHLNMDQAFVSRIIGQLVKRGDIHKSASPHDRRVTYLYVTQQGEDALVSLNDMADRQMEGLLEKLSDDERHEVGVSIGTLSRLLLEGQSDVKSPRAVTIRNHLKPGDAGELIAMHGKIYEKECGYNHRFEGYVCKTFYEGLVHGHDKDRYWIAECDDEIIGSVAVLEKEDGVAQLRWLLIKPEFRSIGLGRKLFNEAMEYAEKGQFTRIFLDTTREQEKAIGFYEKAGFEVIDSHPINDWGKVLEGLTLEKKLI